VTIDIAVLRAHDTGVLERVAPDVFDGPIDARLAAEFLEDTRHHIAVAIDAGIVVGFASAVHYVHPDKPAELWINEVGVAPSHQRRGLGTRLLGALVAVGREHSCREAWVLTDFDNEAAHRLYGAVGGRPSEHVMFSIPISD
jgi:GNAT superfamily N-acetyltransferase